MKKILLFLFALFLVSIKVDAAYYITINQINASDIPRNYLTYTDIYNSNYNIIDSKTNVTLMVYKGKNTVSYGSNLDGWKPTTFQIKEVSNSTGFLNNILLDTEITLDERCPKARIDIEKIPIKYQMTVEFKSDVSNECLNVINDQNTLIYDNCSLTSQVVFDLYYDRYFLKINNQTIYLNLLSPSINEDGIIFENDFLKVMIIKEGIEPYFPKTTIVKGCFDDDYEYYEEVINVLRKDNENENNQNSITSTSKYNEIPIEGDIEDESNENNEEVINDNNDESEIITDEKPVSIINEEELVVAQDEVEAPLISNPVITKKPQKKIVKKESFQNPNEIVNNDEEETIVSEELESNLIIDQGALNPPDKKVSYASNLPLIITISIVIFTVLTLKIVKKVRKM